MSTFAFPFDEHSFVEVKVKPGFMSDPSKLEFNYDVVFIDAKIIEVSVEFHNPAYVSANQPEDVLEVTLWGPFFD